jgi:2-oxoglutarate ferredoxin oxidoreductase subunit delta
MSEADEVNVMGTRYPVLFAGCTACRACREVCPDFVFEVYRYDEAQDLKSAATAMSVSSSQGATDGRAG